MSYVDSLVIHDLDLGYGTREQVEGYLSELESGGRALAELRAAGTVKAFGAGCNMFSPEQQCDEFARRIAKIVDLDCTCPHHHPPTHTAPAPSLPP